MNREVPSVLAAARTLAWLLALTLAAGAGAEPRTLGRLGRIQAAGALRVCIWPDYYGISYRNARTLQLAGIDIDNAHDLAKALGVDVQFVDSSFVTLVDDVNADRCDIAMFAIGITPARQQRLRFTQPHLVSDIYAVTTRANRRIRAWADIDAPGTVVAVAKGTLHETVMKDKLRHAELRVLDTPHAREEEVHTGRADVFMTDYPFGRRFAETSEWARLIAPASTYHPTPYGWALKAGDEEFRDAVDRVLAAMKADGRLLANARRHGLEPIVAP